MEAPLAVRVVLVPLHMAVVDGLTVTVGGALTVSKPLT